MFFNLIDKIQQALGFSIQKIDPNTQEVRRPENQSPQDFLPQAAVPTILLGMYKYSRSVDGNTEILKNTNDGNVLRTVFGDLTPQVVARVASYTGNDEMYTQDQMERIASQAAVSMNEELKGNVTGGTIKTLLTDQRHNILVHLPAGLQIGEVIQDKTVDDRANKMEGPMSSHMHWLEKLFSTSPPKKEDLHNAPE